MEFLEDFDFELHYHPGKTNVVADALSRKIVSSLASVAIREWTMLGEVGKFELYLGVSEVGATLFALSAQPTLICKVVKAQRGDREVELIRDRISNGKEEKGLNIHSDQSVHYLDRLFVAESCKEEVL
ncbi:hypothetical protein ACSBR1_003824 [Camellia fascicularis]